MWSSFSPFLPPSRAALGRSSRPPTHGRERPRGKAPLASRPRPTASDSWVSERLCGVRPPGRARRCPPACARRRSPAAFAATSLAAAPAYWQRRGPRHAPRASHRAPPPGAGLRPSPVDIARRFARSARRGPPVALRAPGAPERLTCRAAIIRCPGLLIWI